jgi:hypothetical protein
MTRYDFSSLIGLYQKMDLAYNQVAACYDFHCTGCTDNCCTSLFFHHTFIEKAFVIQGFSQMEKAIQKQIQDKAADYVNRTFSTPGTHRSLKRMCPLNREGKCVLYFYRPMICRLHGLPHELHPPGRQKIRGSGCDAGSFDAKTYIPFDRTPFYVEMAAIEQQFKDRHSKTGRPRQTIAQILIDPQV